MDTTRHQALKVGIAFKTMQMIFFGLLAGMVAATVFIQDFNFEVAIDFDTIPMLYWLILFGAIVVGMLLFKLNMKSTFEIASLKSKLARYQVAMLIRFAIIEAAVFFLLFAASREDNLHLLFIAILLGYFAYLFPSKSRVIKELQLDIKDQQALEKEEEYLV